VAGTVVIAGGGLGAVRTAEALRSAGFDGSIVVLSEESEAPYDRPPLSKNFLLGRASDEDIRLLREDLDLDMRLGHRVTALDARARTVTVEGGEEISYDDLVIATGARPKRIPALEGRAGVHYLRTAEDSRAIRESLRPGARLGIVGAGFIGLEVASVATELGCEVTVIEAAPAPLALVLGTEIGGWIQEWHESHGVQFRCGSMLRGASGEERISALELEDGSSVPVDVAVVGVGIAPNIEWLADSGLELHDGLVCDGNGCTSDPHVFGVGDVACVHVDEVCHPVGHWTAVGEQAMRAADAVLGSAEGPGAAPDGYFWSDQFDARLQFTGAVAAEPQVSLASGSVEERKFVALCEDGERLTAVFAMSNPREFVRNSMALRG
jgi:3-phenylpropionate/trans-cinnamate dioxygenase ferredoxin reductase component